MPAFSAVSAKAAKSSPFLFDGSMTRAFRKMFRSALQLVRLSDKVGGDYERNGDP